MVRVPYYIPISVVIVIILAIIYFSRRKERFENPPIQKQTPGERGLVFGYVPTNPNDKKVASNTNVVKPRDNIRLYNNNKYFGYSNKNRLLPNFLERLGTFTPYSYESIKIHVKDNQPQILYNTSKIYFTVYNLHDMYYLQFVPNTNTFYLSNKPTYFSFVNVKEPNSTTEVKYDDNILIKCLDNSEYVFVYEELMITEKDKSSTFVIKNGEQADICANLSNTSKDFMPKVMAKEQVEQLERQYRKDIDDYVANLRGTKSSEINTIKENIRLLEQQLEIAKGSSRVRLEKEKLKHQEDMKVKEAGITSEINKFKADKDIEFAKTKEKVVNERKSYWLKEIDELRTLMDKKCASNTKKLATKPVQTTPTKAPVKPTKVLMTPTKASVKPTKVLMTPTKAPIKPTKVLMTSTKAPVKPTKVKMIPKLAQNKDNMVPMNSTPIHNTRDMVPMKPTLAQNKDNMVPKLPWSAKYKPPSGGFNLASNAGSNSVLKFEDHPLKGGS
jgi:hypothetical protein